MNKGRRRYEHSLFSLHSRSFTEEIPEMVNAVRAGECVPIWSRKEPSESVKPTRLRVESWGREDEIALTEPAEIVCGREMRDRAVRW